MTQTSSWTEVRVADVVTRSFSGPSPTCEERNVRGDEWGVLKTTCTTWEHGWDQWKHKVLPPSFWGKRHLEVRPGDTIITKAGPRHRVAVPSFVSAAPPRIVPSGKMICLRPDSRRVEPGFLALALSDSRTQAYIDQRTTGMAESQVNFENRDLLGAPIWLPSLEDQRRILGPLSDADSLIERLKRLIAKKGAIKQGMLQHLLTGEARLPGFREVWREELLGNLATIDPETIPSTTDPRAVINYIALEDVTGGKIHSHTDVRFGAAPSRARRAIRRSDILFGTVRPNLRSHSIYSGSLRRPVASTGFAVVRTGDQADPQFIFNLLMSDLAMVQIDRIIAGSNYPAISSGDVRKLLFKVPNLDEQRAIGAVLEDLDEELQVLERRLAKARMIKQGMMQELLAARTHLPVLEVES